MPRPSRDLCCLLTAFVWSQRSTCPRRQVGCVLVNDRGHILATGYNGVPVGQRHCAESLPKHQCPGANAESGTELDKCYAIHAESNALLQCPNVWDIYTCYCTNLPCITCLKLLRNTSCQRIVYSKPYINPAIAEVWDRELIHLDIDKAVDSWG